VKDRRLYILHAIDCIDRIHQFTSEGRDAFLSDIKTQDAVIRNIEVIGQCIKDYGVDELSSASPGIPWNKIAGMRNILAHEYLGVDVALVWEVVDRYLRGVKEALDRVVIK
jgi:uncharacterized protein with HEPN domain